MVYHVQFPGLGLDLTVNRVALAIGGFNIYWYGVIIAAGMLLAMLYAFRNAVDYGIDSDRLVDVVAIGTVMAIVCARIYYVAMAPFAYQSLWEMIDIRKGGIAIYGAVIGAFVFGALAAKWRKVPLLPLFDLVSLGFLIGQGIGRWGNFVNQEAFGTNTTLPWGMYSEGTEAYPGGQDPDQRAVPQQAAAASRRHRPRLTFGSLAVFGFIAMFAVHPPISPGSRSAAVSACR